MTPIGAAALAILREWLPPDDDPVRPLLQLATLDEAGHPDVRSVLLSGWGPGGLAFHTDSRSRKVAQLDRRPEAALVLADAAGGRQLTVQGTVRRTTPDQDAAVYALRTPYLRRLAWVNDAELAQADQATRRAAWGAFGETHEDAELVPPPTWVGFLVEPTRLTFWEADLVGPSHRIEHRLAAGEWTVHHLPG